MSSCGQCVTHKPNYKEILNRNGKTEYNLILPNRRQIKFQFVWLGVYYKEIYCYCEERAVKPRSQIEPHSLAIWSFFSPTQKQEMDWLQQQLAHKPTLLIKRFVNTGRTGIKQTTNYRRWEHNADRAKMSPWTDENGETQRYSWFGWDDGFKASGVKDGDEWMQITSTWLQ